MDRLDRSTSRRAAEAPARAGRLTVGFLRDERPARKGMVTGAVVAGIGLGGFLDGIFLHQVLQWHHMVSAIVPMTTLAGLEANTRADGVFNLSMWIATVVGFGLLWRSVSRDPAARLRTRTLVGWLLVGWGVFHFIDSLTFHALLGLHHIRQVETFLAYDIGFFLMGVALVAVGLYLVREPKGLLPSER